MKRKAVFIAEDDFTREANLASKLKERGFNVVTGSGENLFAEIKRAKPEAIITKVGEPVEGVESLLDQIRGEIEFKECELFVYAEKIDIKLEIKLRKLKVNNYFQIEGETCERIIEQVGKFAEGFGEEEPIDLVQLVGPDEADDDEDLTENFFPYLEQEIPRHEVKITPASETAIPLTPEEKFKKAKSYMDTSKNHEAINLFLHLMENDDEFTEEANLLAGICYRRLKKYKNAVDILQKGARESSNRDKKIEFRYELGVTLQEAGKLAEASKFLFSVYKNDKYFKDTAKRIQKIQKNMKEM